MKSWGVQPAAVIGHSLGEHAALNHAGVISPWDTIWLCGRRAQLLAEYCDFGTHSMLAVRAGKKEVLHNLTAVDVEVACVNSPHETVVGGTKEAVDCVAQRLQLAGIRARRIELPYAFHSSQVEPILPQLAKLLNRAVLKSPMVPIISPLRLDVIQTDEIIEKDYLVRQCREPVNLLSAIQAG
jgi:naphtho-gamma-pyrone polyketide synthase